MVDIAASVLARLKTKPLKQDEAISFAYNCSVRKNSEKRAGQTRDVFCLLCDFFLDFF